MERPDAWHLTERVRHEAGKGDPFAAAVRGTRMPMIITDPRQDDNPVVFVNDAFLKLTGYDRDEVMGLNCRFLQGRETDPRAVRSIAQALAAKTDISIDLLNYRKDGTRFWNALYISPVFGEAGEIQYFFASQIDITDRYDALAVKVAMLHEVDHRVKNNMLMISSLISTQAKAVADAQTRRTLDAVLKRIEALSAVHRRLYQSDDATRFSVAEFVHDITTELAGTTGRDDIVIALDLEHIDVPAGKAAPLALVLNELITSALNRVLPVGRSGGISVAVKRDGEHLRIEVQDDGVGMPDQPPVPDSPFGENLVRMLVRQLRASVTWSNADIAGTRVTIDLPIENPGPGV